MKILVASLFFPQFTATHAGGRFVAELVRELSKKHEVHLASRIEETELDSVAEMKRYCKEVHLYPYRQIRRRDLLTSARLVVSYLRFGAGVNSLLRSTQFDLAQVEWVEAGVFVRKKRGTPMIIDAHDVITKPAERSLSRQSGIRRVFAYLLYRMVRAVELRTLKRFDLVVTRAEYDRQYLLSLHKDLPVAVIPHPAGLDISGKSFDRQKNTILFLASFKHRQTNVDAALYFYRQVLPLVRARIPEARFIIAGYGPPDQLTSISRKDNGVIVPGFVEDVEEYYKKASVFVAPILVGGGIIVKVLDAMASGTPVVTTSFGNEGIGAESGKHVIVADDPQSFADGVIRILEDSDYGNRLGEKGQDYIRGNYGKDAVFSKFESLYSELIRTGR